MLRSLEKAQNHPLPYAERGPNEPSLRKGGFLCNLEFKLILSIIPAYKGDICHM